MGILANDLKLLLECRSRGAAFDKVLTMGRLSVNVPRHEFEKMLVRHKLKSADGPTFFEQYGTGLNGDDLFRLLGAKITDSMDASDFEGASIIHDLNQPLPQRYENQYDIVFDGGTLEHVFNFPVALHNAMRAVKPGGRLFICQIANNGCGHGFYCFSPELFYRTLAPKYGFKIERFLGYEPEATDKVYTIPDSGPKVRRLYIRSRHSVLIVVQAQKIGDCRELFQSPPQQFDYAEKWSDHGKAVVPKPQKKRKHSFLHDYAWYAHAQAWRQRRRRNRREDRKYSLTNAEIFEPYHFLF